MKDKGKLSLAAISAIVFGSMIGGGIFNIAQNMAAGAETGAVAISWVVTALGMLCLVYTFKLLNELRPDLNAGIYQYAQQGFGNYIGFNIAWGYWICTACGNVAYAVMLNDSLGVIWPVLLRHGWSTVVLDSALIWSMYALVVHGIHSASLVNTLITLLKIVCLALISVALLYFFSPEQFTADFWGEAAGLGSVGDQIESTMMVTLWCFVGIEGAVVMAARARKPSDVGKAGMIGFLLAWLLYTLISVMCFGVMSRADMAALENPSVAYVMRYLCGDSAYYFVIGAIVVALIGGWIAWTMMCAQVPSEAATVGIMPKQLLRLNRHGSAAYALLVSTLMMQVLILVVCMAEQVYMAAVVITSMMVLPAYLFSALFLLKAAYYPERYLPVDRRSHICRYKIAGYACSLYCLWLLYAGGLSILMTTSLCYLAGVWFYVRARRENAPAEPVFRPYERVVLAVLCLLGVVSVVLLALGCL